MTKFTTGKMSKWLELFNDRHSTLTIRLEPNDLDNVASIKDLSVDELEASGQRQIKRAYAMASLSKIFLYDHPFFPAVAIAVIISTYKIGMASLKIMWRKW